MQDTFWLDGGNLLRTHTSPVQVRGMERLGRKRPLSEEFQDLHAGGATGDHGWFIPREEPIVAQPSGPFIQASS